MGFTFKLFQILDLARAALLNGVILSWEPGLGKTIAAFAWAKIKGAKRVLLVVPANLHRHFRIQGRENFGFHVTHLSHRRQLRSFGLDKPLDRSLPTRFFITSYQELGFNNTRDGSPSLAQCIAKLMAKGAGFDCVIIDEGTKLQSTETYISIGVRILYPKFRMVLTGTPVKNRLESFFWLGWWAAGGMPLWPYAGTAAARSVFARDHLMSMKPEEGGRSVPTARITNLHHLWTIIAPIIIRRRKSQCGEDIPPKTVQVIRLQPGTQQKAVYQNHLFFPPVTSQKGNAVKGFGRVAMQLNILRQAALCPHTDKIGRVHSRATGPKQTDTDFNPKLAACLSLIARLIAKGEQVLIGSPFRAFSHSLQDRLTSAGVSCLLLDGQTRPRERGELAQGFKDGKIAVLIAGIGSMAEGNDFPNCHHVILPSLSWAYDENEQFPDRIWRLNSTGPVTVYKLVLAGTIDERLHELFEEKRESAQLAVDGLLTGDHFEETDLSMLLKHAVRAFDRNASTIDESLMQLQWHSQLRDRLGRAESKFRLSARSRI